MPSAGELTGQDILAKLIDLPVSGWRYNSEDEDVRHLGPMAQDFYAAFGLGNDEKSIAFVDAVGVLIVSVQALARRVAELEKDDE